MIQYKSDAQMARAHLLRAYNDLLVFVEDKTCHNMHVRVLSAILSGAGRIENVFPLGGRSKVVNAALSDPGDNPKRVYVIDGDLDLLTEIDAPKCSRLYRLSAYCMENLIITERSIIEVACECAVDEPESEIAKRILFQSGKDFIVRALLPLFEHYAIVYRLNLKIETVSHSVVRLCEKKDGLDVLSPYLVARRVREVRQQIVDAVGWVNYKSALSHIRDISSRLVDKSRVLSGKDYLLPLVHAYLRTSLRMRDSFDGLRVRLSRHFNPSEEPAFRDFLLNALRDGFSLK